MNNANNTNNKSEGKAKTFWKGVGIFFLALGLAVVTVFVLNLNRT